MYVAAWWGARIKGRLDLYESRGMFTSELASDVIYVLGE